MIAALEEYFEKLLSGMDFEYSYHSAETGEKISERESLLSELDKIPTGRNGSVLPMKMK